MPDEFVLETDEFFLRDENFFIRIGDGTADDRGGDVVFGGDFDGFVGIGGGQDDTETDSHVENIVHLFVRDAAGRLDEIEDGRRSGEIADLETNCGSDAIQVKQTVAGDVDEGFHVQGTVEHFEDGFDIDAGGLENFLAERVLKVPGGFAEGVSPAVQQNAAGKSEAVAVNAAALQSDHEIAGPDVFTGKDTIHRHDTDASGDEIERFTVTTGMEQFLDLSDLSGGNGDISLDASLVDTLHELVDETGIGDFDGDVIHQGEGPGADAEHVVDVHGDTVDADRIVFFHRLGDENFCADSIGGDGDTLVIADVDYVGEITEIQENLAYILVESKRVLDKGTEIRHGLRGGGGIDPGFPVGIGTGLFVAHVKSRPGQNFDGSRTTCLMRSRLQV